MSGLDLFYQARSYLQRNTPSQISGSVYELKSMSKTANFKKTKYALREQKNNHFSRRQILQNGLLGSMVLFTGVGVSFANGISAVGHQVDSQMGISVLISALRSTGNVVCLKAAQRLEASRASKVEYVLHLRNADLGASDAEIIAHGIHQNYLTKGPALLSFSMSYNPGLTDSGVVALARAFPSTLTELGLVGCAIGDECGAALLRWSKQATELRMICVEGNNFSSSIRLAFTALAQERPSLLIVV